MSHNDDDWAWIETLPKSWRAPAELQSPTRVPEINLAIKMLSSEMIGNDIIEQLGRFLSADAAHNMWFATAGKRSRTPHELALLNVQSSEILGRIYEAWHQYSTTLERAGRRAGTADLEYAALRAALEDGIAKLLAMSKR